MAAPPFAQNDRRTAFRMPHHRVVQGLITGTDVVREGFTIVRLWGLRCYLRCLSALISRRHCTFLEVLYARPQPRVSEFIPRLWCDFRTGKRALPMRSGAARSRRGRARPAFEPMPPR